MLCAIPFPIRRKAPRIGIIHRKSRPTVSKDQLESIRNLLIVDLLLMKYLSPSGDRWRFWQPESRFSWHNNASSDMSLVLKAVVNSFKQLRR